MSITIRRADEVAKTHGVKCLVYGKAGTGKTSLVATAPAPLLISAESGVLSLRKENIERMFGVGTQGITYDIPVIEIDSIDRLREVDQWVRNSAEAQQYQTICLDSLSDIAEVVLASEKSKVKDSRLAYGELANKMINIIKSFRDLQGKHVYMSAKESRMQDPATGATYAVPSMPGTRLSNEVPYLFDEVFNLNTRLNVEQNVKERYMLTETQAGYDAKDRSGRLAAYEHPHLGYLFNKIING